MIEAYFLISLIVITDGTILLCKYLFDKSHYFDKELKPDLIISADYWNALALPLIFVLPFVWLQGLTETKKELYLLPFLATGILNFSSLALLLTRRLKRYYLTSKGIVILNLLTNKYAIIPIADIQGYVFRQGYRSASNYLVATTQKRINFNVRQIKNIEIFKDYFKRNNVQYYEHDSLTGNNYKK